MFRRLLNWLFSTTTPGVVRHRVIHTRTSSDRLRFENAATGEVREWESWDDVPDDVKAMIQKARSTDSGNEVLTRTYDELEDVPTALREKIRVALPDAAIDDFTVRTMHDTDYVFTDESGVTRRYETLDEMPPHIRAIFERHGIDRAE